MGQAQDVEISLGTGRLLGLFFGLVVVCAVFFGLGYTVGRNSSPASLAAVEPSTVSAASNAPKPKAGASDTAAAPSGNDLTFYKTVEQKAPAQLTPAAAKTTTPSFPSAPSAPATDTETATTPTSEVTHGFVVQIAAVTKKEDADALVVALRKKSYPVFVASNAPIDPLFHVQVGPYNDIRDAEAMRARLAGEGYTPIVKK